MSFHFSRIHLSFYVVFNAVPPKLLWVHDMGWGWGCSFVGMATGPKNDVQWAKQWRTVGQNVTYAGLKSDVRAKMQHWSVMIWFSSIILNVNFEKDQEHMTQLSTLSPAAQTHPTVVIRSIHALVLYISNTWAYISYKCQVRAPGHI